MDKPEVSETQIIKLCEIAALADCIEAVDMQKVKRYRPIIDQLPPIFVCQVNSNGFYILEDGNHRVMASLLEGRASIRAEIIKEPVNLSWRWPRIAPVTTTFELMQLTQAHPSVDEMSASMALRLLYDETLDYVVTNKLGGKDSTHGLKIATKVLAGTYNPSLSDYLHHALESLKADPEFYGEAKDLLEQIRGFLPESSHIKPLGYIVEYTDDELRRCRYYCNSEREAEMLNRSDTTHYFPICRMTDATDNQSLRVEDSGVVEKLNQIISMMRDRGHTMWAFQLEKIREKLMDHPSS